MLPAVDIQGSCPRRRGTAGWASAVVIRCCAVVIRCCAMVIRCCAVVGTVSIMVDAGRVMVARGCGSIADLRLEAPGDLLNTELPGPVPCDHFSFVSPEPHN